jgi:hypothetical protein
VQLVKEEFMKKLQLLGWIFILGFCGWIGKNTYHYFFDKKSPEVILSGIVNGGYYAGDISCVVNGSHPYKVGKISVFLDGTPLIYNFSLGKSSFEHPFTINTRTLTNGKHDLKVKLIDGTFHKNEACKECQFNVDNTHLQAAFVRSVTDLKVFQGRTLTLQFQTSKPLKEAKVHAFSKQFDCVPEKEGSLVYEAFVPIDCEETPNEYLFTVNCIDQVENVVTLEGKVQVVPFPFKKGNLSVPVGSATAEYVAKEKELGLSQKILNDQLAELAEKSPHKKLWQGQFCAPTDIIRITTEFGNIRTTPQRGRYAHKAIDIANHPRSIIWAPQDGVVIVKERYSYSGNTVAIDHGCGVISLLFHLDSFADDLAVGQVIKKGNPVGKLGKTGYADGYHLHWEMRIKDIAIDPLEWTKFSVA